MVEEPAGDTGVLAGDEVGGRQHLERPERDVAQVPDRGGDQVKPALERRCDGRQAVHHIAAMRPGGRVRGCGIAALCVDGRATCHPPILAPLDGAPKSLSFSFGYRSTRRGSHVRRFGGLELRLGAASIPRACGRRPGRGLLVEPQPGRPFAQCADPGTGAVHGQYRGGQGQGWADPAALGQRQCRGGGGVHAQFRRACARRVQQPRHPAPGEGRPRHRAGRAAGGAAGARRGRRDHPRTAVCHRGRAGGAGGAGARRPRDRVLYRRQCGGARCLSPELPAGIRCGSHHRLCREPGSPLVRGARPRQRLWHRGRGRFQAAGGAPRRPRGRARALSPRQVADARRDQERRDRGQRPRRRDLRA